MSTVAGIFPTGSDAERAIENLRSAGIGEKNINLLTPGTAEEEIEARVATTETEQPGMGSAMGGAVGAALGTAGGLQIGAALASLFVPGVGPVIAGGILGAALLGLGGAAAGAAAGGALEETIEGLPHDELYVYEDALRQGRSVVFVATDDTAEAETIRGILAGAGAESLDAARETWWLGLRDVEAEEYEGPDFSVDEHVYRRGFEAAQHPSVRGKNYDAVQKVLSDRYGDVYESNAFRQGYARGYSYQRGLQEKYKR